MRITCFLFVVVIAAGSAGAVVLQPGDVLAVISTPNSALIRINPVTGVTTTILSDPYFPFEVATEPTGTVLIHESDRIARYNPATGSVLTLANTGPFDFFRELTVSETGAIYLTNRDYDEILSVDPVTGAFSTATIGGFLNLPKSIAVEETGMLLVADSQKLYRVNPATRAQTLVGPVFIGDLDFILLESPTSLIAAGFDSDEIVRVNLLTWAQETVIALSDVTGIAREFDGHLLAIVRDEVLRMDPDGGNQTVLFACGAECMFVSDIAVVRTPEPSASLAGLCVLVVLALLGSCRRHCSSSASSSNANAASWG